MLNTIKGIFRKKSKKVTALMLVFLMVIVMVPNFMLPVMAASGDVTGNLAFKVIAYDISARIEMPNISGATNYKVYMSTANDTDLSTLNSDGAKMLIINSSSYVSTTYAINGDNGVTISPDTTYYFYFVTNNGSDTLQSTFEAKTRTTATSYWTDEGNYDISWYTDVSSYSISTARELAGLAVLTNGLNGVSAVDFSGKIIELSALLDTFDMSAYLWTPIGTNSNEFKGTFNAGGYKISGLHTNDGTKNYQGLFGYSGPSSVIENIGMVNGYIQGNDYVGGVVGQSTGTVSNCYNTGSVSGTGYVGGVAGYFHSGDSLTNCYNTGSVSGTDYVGGVVGGSDSTISNCYNTGSVSGTSQVGGVVGYSNNVPISNCYNTGAVRGTGNLVGGVVGYSSSQISNCYNTGSVNGTSYVGGVVGQSIDSLTNCYNTGSVNGTSTVGGVVGYSGASLTNCHNTGAVSGTGNVGGVAGAVWSGSTISNCYNTGSVSGTTYVGGVVGSIEGTISTCYNTGSVSGTSFVGGVVGYSGASLTNCYNTGSISGAGYVGGVVGYSNNSGTISNCYYCGYSGGVGTGPTSATDTAGTIPFISYTSPLGNDRVTDIKECTLAMLDEGFKAAFGIIGILYPDAYTSSDTSIITVDGKTIVASATNVGTAFVNGAGTNDKIIISQNALNMTDTTSGFSGAGTTLVVGTVSLPVTVDTSTAGSLPITVTPSVSTNPTFGVAVTLSATLTGESTLSGKIITFALKDESDINITLNPSTATTNDSGVATLSSTWTPTAVGTYTLTVSYLAPDGTTKTGTKTIIINEKSLIVTPTAVSKYYGQSDYGLTYTYSGNAVGETPAFIGALARAPGENVGNYAITLGSLGITDNSPFKSSNYTIALSGTPVNFSILEYIVEASASAVQPTTNGWFNSATVELAAPSGYTISTSDALDINTWATTITLNTTDGASKSATYYLKDNATGAITVQKTFSYKVDKTTPVKITATYETNTFESFLNAVSFGLFFKESVTVTLAAEDTTSEVKEFTVTMADGRPFTVTNSTFNIQPQYIGNFSVSATDNAGNISESVDFEYLAVDSATPIAPTVTNGSYTVGSWTANDVTFTVSGSTALSGIAKYQYSKDGGANWIDLTTTESTLATASTPYNATKAVLTVTDGQDNYQFRAVSNSGINGVASVGVSVKIDAVTPVISVTHTPTDLSTVTESNVVFTLSNTATNASGVTYYVQKDTGEFTLVSGNTYTVNTTDASTYTFKSMSGANVESAVSDGYTVNVVKPIFTAITVDTNGYTPGTWTSATVTLTLSGGLDASTFSKYQYSTNATSWSDVTGSTIQVGSNFSGTYFFRAVSRSYSTGSETTGTAVKVDKVINFTVTASGDTSTISQSNTATLSITGVGASAVEKVEVQKDSDAWTDITSTYESGYTVTANGSYVFRVTNGAGVGKTSVALLYNNIDTATPTVSINSNGYTENTWTNKDVIINITNNTANLGTAIYKYSTDNGNTYLTFDGSLSISNNTNIMYTFKVISQSGVESNQMQFTVKRDSTVPNGSVEINTNTWTEFLNNITFGLFFKETVNVTVTGADALSGIQKTEYFKSPTVLTLEQAKEIPSWTEYTNVITETAVDAESFIYYVKLTDNAGNVQYLSSDKTTFDTTAPIIEGIANGETYYVDQTVTVTDTNIDTITVNGNPFTSGSKLLANKDETYIIVAIDKSGNRVTYTVTTKTIASIFDSIKYITGTNVKSTDKATIQAVLDTVNAVLGTTRNGATGEQIDALGAIKDNTSNLLTKTGENGMELMMIGGLMLFISGSIMFLFISRRAQALKATKRV